MENKRLLSEDELETINGGRNFGTYKSKEKTDITLILYIMKN